MRNRIYTLFGLVRIAVFTLGRKSLIEVQGEETETLGAIEYVQGFAWREDRIVLQADFQKAKIRDVLRFLHSLQTSFN